MLQLSNVNWPAARPDGKKMATFPFLGAQSVRLFILNKRGTPGKLSVINPGPKREDMGHFTQTSNVAGGRIKAVCSRCGKTAYPEVAAKARLRTHRCTCGKSTTYKINYRTERRETTYGPARLVMRNAQEQKIRLNDTSLNGVSFFIPSEIALSIRRGQEVGIKFRSSGGSSMQRRICIKNVDKNRIGAQFVRSGASW